MVDFVLTFEELNGIFGAKGVDFDNLETEPSQDASSALGKGFATSGGVANAVIEVLKEMKPDMDIKVTKAEGLDECKKMLLMAQAGKSGEANYHAIEIMACPGGCVGGAGVLCDSRKAAAQLKMDMNNSSFTSPSDTEYSEYLSLITKED